ncbi:SDR family oxidoreductase [Secundilactobacillus collinoides]|nr:SDR family NAD(P)-dependent oxidoreductase [Secundilactobacillus collinoides]
MKLENHHILITGGTSGIGFALAKRFLDLGNEVLAVDFSEKNIEAAKKERPELLTYKADLSAPADREALKTWVDANFSELDILFNDAGIQRWINLQHLTHDWDWYHQELAVNLEAQLHLTFLFLPQITAQPNGAFINISSGLVINNGAWVPIYAASKYGVHGFTEALRYQLQDTATKVFEIMPPAVNTNLGGAGEHNYGNDLADFADAVIQQLQDDLPEITFASSWDQLRADKETNRKTTQETWNLFKDNPTFKNA